VNILVTGGAGFIGSNFLEMLVKGELECKPNSIYVLDSLTYAGNLANIKELIHSGSINFTEGSICDSDLVEKLIKKCDVVVNFAAESHVDNSIRSSKEFVETNVLGTQVLLNSCINIKKIRFLQVSTDEVYGSISKGSWDENCILQPSSPYSASKAASDLLSLAMYKTHGIDVIISRCTNNYGPRQHTEKLIPKLISQAKRNEPLTIYGNGKNLREWIHVFDHCRALGSLLMHGKAGEIYNIGSDDELENIEIAQIIISKIPQSTSKIKFIPDRLGHDFRYSLNDNKFREIGDRNRLNFRNSIKDTIGWYL
jgi:dTDP-glucose 4,6-dehydratase